MGKEVPHEYVEVLGWIIDLGIASIVILVALPLTEYSAIIGSFLLITTGRIEYSASFGVTRTSVLAMHD